MDATATDTQARCLRCQTTIGLHETNRGGLCDACEEATSAQVRASETATVEALRRNHTPGDSR
jgi:Zn finger protein HypA/HybF involved in hydrogenase expression